MLRWHLPHWFLACQRRTRTNAAFTNLLLSFCVQMIGRRKLQTGKKSTANRSLRCFLLLGKLRFPAGLLHASQKKNFVHCEIVIAANAFKSRQGLEKKHFTTMTYSRTSTVGSFRSVGLSLGPSSYWKSPSKRCPETSGNALAKRISCKTLQFRFFLTFPTVEFSRKNLDSFTFSLLRVGRFPIVHVRRAKQIALESFNLPTTLIIDNDMNSNLLSVFFFFFLVSEISFCFKTKTSSPAHPNETCALAMWLAARSCQNIRDAACAPIDDTDHPNRRCGFCRVSSAAQVQNFPA